MCKCVVSAAVGEKTQAAWNKEEIKSIDLSIVLLCLAESISRSA